MMWIYDGDGTPDMDEVTLAEKGIAAILGNLDLTHAPEEQADSAMCLLSRCLWELADMAAQIQTRLKPS